MDTFKISSLFFKPLSNDVIEYVSCKPEISQFTSGVGFPLPVHSNEMFPDISAVMFVGATITVGTSEKKEEKRENIFIKIN